MATGFFKSTDSGALSLGQAAGDLVALLENYLVTGANGVTPLGWSVEKSTSGNRAYFYSTHGSHNSGCGLYINDDAATPNGKYARGFGVEGWTGFTTETPGYSTRFPTPTHVSWEPQWLKELNATYPVQWYLYGDEAWFMLVLSRPDTSSDLYKLLHASYNNPGYTVVHLFGTLSPLPGGLSAWTVFSGQNQTTENLASSSHYSASPLRSLSIGSNIATTASYLAFARNTAQTVTTVRGAALYTFSGQYDIVGGTAHTQNPYLALPNVPIERVLLRDQDYHLRGYLPGVYFPWQQRSTNAYGAFFTAITDVPALPGRTLVHVPWDAVGSSTPHSALVDITGPLR